MKKLSNILGVIIIFVGIILLSSCVDSSESDFKVDVRFDNYYISDTVVDFFGKKTKTFTIKKGYVVVVSKEYNNNNILKTSYVEQIFTRTKENVPKVVCELKNKIIKERNQDKKLSKQIKSFECNDSS